MTIQAKHLAWIFGFLALLVLAQPTWAYIPPKQIQVELPKIEFQPPEKAPIMTAETLQHIVPTSMKQTSDSREVSNQIMDHSLNSLARGEFLRNSEFAKTAEKVQKAIKPELTFGAPGATQHKLEMELMAMQKSAKIKYSGFVDLNATVQTETNLVDVSIKEDLSPESRLLLTHASLDNRNLIQVNWDW